MAQQTVYPNGTADVTVPYGSKIAIACYGSDQCQIFYGTGPNNFPQTFYLQQTLASAEVTLGTFATVQDVRIEAGAGEVYYNVGASPTISKPTGVVEASTDPMAINGLDSTTGNGGAISLTSGSAVADDVSGAVTIGSYAGGASAAATAGGASGDVILQSGAGGANTGGATGEAGGAGGDLTLRTGAGGATNSTGAHDGGAGGDVALTAGSGGNASAGTGDGGAGGTVTITAGTGGTSAGGTAGADGVIVTKSILLVNQGTPAAKTTSATLTAAEILTGIITLNQGGGAATAQQLPLATAMDTALPDSAAGDSFDFSVINISTNAAEDGSVTTNTGWTLVGNMDVASNAAATDKSAGRFRARKTGAGAWSLYRLS